MTGSDDFKITAPQLWKMGYSVGDRVTIRMPLWKRIRNLFTRPRILVVESVTETTICVQARRMTWAEWRAHIRELWRKA